MGIYFHIPFCRRACHYCDFHFSVSLGKKKEVLLAMHKELELRANYLENKNIETVYFGGGTPSLLEAGEIESFLKQVKKHFHLRDSAEITLEANPDDLTPEKIKELSDAGINRLSIGIQSFRDEDLKWMNRIHSSEEAISAVKYSQRTGIKNITIDLIYGIPGLNDEEWNNNLETAISLDVPHISAYCLTVEPGTALFHQVNKKIAKPVDEEQSARHFLQMMKKLKENNFIAYEISNFGKEGFFSRHNSAYWKGSHYLGIGPSAHSYNGSSRSYNISNNTRYVNALNEATSFSETEILTAENKLNEYLMTGLRTIWGVNENYILNNFDKQLSDSIVLSLEKWKSSGHIKKNNETLVLSSEGRLLADKIIGDLFV